MRDLIEFGTETWGEGQSDVMDARDELATLYREAGRIDDWERAVREALRIKRSVLAEDDSDTEYSRRQLASVLVRRSEPLVLAEKYREALELLSEIRELSPSNGQAESLVSLQIYLDEHASAMEFSRYLYDQAQAASKEGVQQARWLVDSLLSPHADIDTEEAIAFIKPLAEEKPYHLPLLALGMAYYRAGQYEDASKTIPSSDAGAIWIRPIASFFLAMSFAQLDDQVQAEQRFDEAVAHINTIVPTPTTGAELQEYAPPRWALWCLYLGLQREAANVLAHESELKPLLSESDGS